MKKILIVGEGNACRSQMAEGWMRYYTKNYAEVTSAGVVASPLDLNAAHAMSQAIIDISKQTSKTLESVVNETYDFVLFVFTPINLKAFSFNGAPQIVVKPFLRPISGASKKETDANYAKIQDEIENYCFDFVHQYVRKMY